MDDIRPHTTGHAGSGEPPESDTEAASALRAEIASLRARIVLLEAQLVTATRRVAPSGAPPLAPPILRQTASPQKQSQRFEFFIGKNIVPLIGAVAILAATAFLVKYAIDMGYFGKLPPFARFLSGVAIGFALLTAGTLVRRRGIAGAATGLDAAGIGALMVSAALGVFALQIFPPITGAWIAVAAGLLGTAWSIRTQSTVVGTVAILGLFGLPLSFGIFESHSLLSATQLTLALAASLAMHAFGGSRLSILRWLGVIAILLCGGAWISEAVPRMTIVGFQLVWWAMIVAECTWCALAGREARANAVTVILVSLALAVSTNFAWRWSLSPVEWIPVLVGGALVVLAMVLHGFAPSALDSEGSEAPDHETTLVTNACGSLMNAALALGLFLGIGGLYAFVTDRWYAPLWCALSLMSAWIARNKKFALIHWVTIISSLAALISGIVAALLYGRNTGTPSVELSVGNGPTILLHTDESIILLVAVAVAWILALVTGVTSVARVSTRVIGSWLALISGVAWMACSFIVFEEPIIAVAAFAIPAALIAWFPQSTRTGAILALLLAAIGGLFWGQLAFIAGIEIFAESPSRTPLPIAIYIITLAIMSAGLLPMASHTVFAGSRGVLMTLAALVVGADVAIGGAFISASSGLTGVLLALSLVIAFAGVGLLFMAIGSVTNRSNLSVAGALLTAIGIVGAAFVGVGTVFAADFLLQHVADQTMFLILAVVAAVTSLLAYFVARATIARNALAVMRPYADAVAATAIVPIGALLLAACTGGRIAALVASCWIIAVAGSELFLGFRLQRPELRWAGLASFVFLIARLYFIDLADTPTLVRVGLLFMAGLVLIAVGIGYARGQRQLPPGK